MKERVSPITPTPLTPLKQVIIIARKQKTPVEKLNKYTKHPYENRTFRPIASAEMTKLFKKTSEKIIYFVRKK
jgi:hypothetical protein